MWLAISKSNIKKKKDFYSRSSSMENNLQHTSDGPKKLPYKLIKQITNDFRKEQIVGSGAFATVYKGVDENKEEIAVKVLRNINMSGYSGKEFQQELDIHRRLKHQNIVQLVGFCYETEKSVAVFEGKEVDAVMVHEVLCLEYADNGTLTQHISDENSGLDWHNRYKIIKGICEGLKYLHADLEFSVWHLDLKTDNILLDKNMGPKIFDFGSSKLAGEEKTMTATDPVGTIGYLPPEYIERHVISKEFDIFSLGVIISKIMTGQKGYSSTDETTPIVFVDQVLDNWRERLHDRLVLEPRQLEDYCHQIKRCIEIALECMKPNQEERPTIQCIVSDLIKTEIKIGDLGLKREQDQERGRKPTDSYRTKGNMHGSTEREQASRILPERASPDRKVKFSQHTYGPSVDLSTLPMQLPLDFLKTITDDFSDERRLSAGAFGTVYKGIVEDNKVIAVKKLAENAPVPRDKVFTHEVQNLMAIRHDNIVRLIHYCHEAQKKVVNNNGRYIVADIVESFLCYEYVPNGSLDQYIFERSNIMDWNTRFKIIKGICQGLLFLHKIPMIIHMDLKPENILLGDNMVPKIADFGLSRIFNQEQTRINTQNVVGSYGYIAPEYLYRGEISTQSDIYSLGILIMETTTGERNCPNNKQPSGREFIEEVRKTWTADHIVSNYPSVDANSLREIKTCIETGLMCVEIERKKRPSIEEIVNRLNDTFPC